MTPAEADGYLAMGDHAQTMAGEGLPLERVVSTILHAYELVAPDLTEDHALGARLAETLQRHGVLLDPTSFRKARCTEGELLRAVTDKPEHPNRIAVRLGYKSDQKMKVLVRVAGTQHSPTGLDTMWAADALAVIAGREDAPILETTITRKIPKKEWASEKDERGVAQYVAHDVIVDKIDRYYHRKPATPSAG